jgi:hypothetical protein
MDLDGVRLRTALPAVLHEAWDRITEIDAALASALAAPAEASFEDLAAERQRRIEEFVAAFPVAPEGAGLRAEALRHLLAVNDALSAATREALVAATAVSATASRQRKAISAYRTHQPEA